MNYEILGGLKAAIERGQSVQSSANAFLNAGYTRAEIDEAVRALESPEPKPAYIPKIISSPEKPKPIFKKLPAPVQIPSSAPLAQTIETSAVIQKPAKKIQKTVYYEGENPNERLLIIVLVSFLILLIGILMLLFIFRKDLINFFSSLSTG